jgi:hypothetical protein
MDLIFCLQNVLLESISSILHIDYCTRTGMPFLMCQPSILFSPLKKILKEYVRYNLK